jgi:hypothetical protein
MNQQTFMQQYREWERLERRLKPTLDRLVIERYGRQKAELFEQYSEVRHRTCCTVHTRINFRAVAVATLANWSSRSLELNRLWRSWSRKKVRMMPTNPGDRKDSFVNE